jgi:hypothetical protein
VATGAVPGKVLIPIEQAQRRPRKAKDKVHGTGGQHMLASAGPHAFAGTGLARPQRLHEGAQADQPGGRTHQVHVPILRAS